MHRSLVHPLLELLPKKTEGTMEEKKIKKKKEKQRDK